MIKPIYIEFNCNGYFGFGMGVAIQRRHVIINYCNACPLSQECWTNHRKRVQKNFPDVCALIDELGKKTNGQKLIHEFIRRHKTEPYSAVLAGNITDGSFISAGQPPQERGEMTLKYPFI
jgi:hypothetical protein